MYTEASKRKWLFLLGYIGPESNPSRHLQQRSSIVLRLAEVADKAPRGELVDLGLDPFQQALVESPIVLGFGLIAGEPA